MTTTADVGKVKRIRNNPRVEFAACTQRGKVTGPFTAGTSRILSPEETESVLVAKRCRYRTARLVQMLPSHRNQIGIENIWDRRRIHCCEPPCGCCGSLSTLHRNHVEAVDLLSDPAMEMVVEPMRVVRGR